MTHISPTLSDSVEKVLFQTSAQAGDHYSDDFGNDWLVQEDRDGLRLQINDRPDAWIPYWTAQTIRLPGLHKMQ